MIVWNARAAVVNKEIPPAGCWNGCCRGGMAAAALFWEPVHMKGRAAALVNNETSRRHTAGADG